MLANILPADPHLSASAPPPDLGMGSTVQNSTFSEHGHVAYQTECNQECSSMLANILPADPPDLLNGVKRSNFNF